MRILYSHRIQSHDGQSVHVEEMVRALRVAGHEVMVVGPSFYRRGRFGGDSRQVQLIRWALPRPIGELAELAYTIPSYLRLLLAWRRFAPDLVYERYALFHLAGALLARWQGAPPYLEVNSPLAAEREEFSDLRLVRLANVLERFTWRSATCVLAVSHALKEIIATAGVAPGQVRVIPNGVALERYPKRPIKPHAPPLVLGFVGFVRPWHGLDTVLHGMAADPQGDSLRLHVIGTGPAVPGLQHLAGRLGIADRVIFDGVVAREALPFRVMKFDVALQPQARPYASPLKIFDYMAAGCAIVAPDQPNIRELLEDEDTALLFDPAAPNGLWQAVQRLIADPALRGRIGRAARECLESRDYTWAANAARLVATARCEPVPGSVATPETLPL